MLGRKMTNQQVIEAAENCKKAGINRLTFNIVGMPLETAENMRQTLELNRRIAPEFFFFFPYIPLRGTPLYNKAKEEGLLLTSKKNLHYLSAANDKQFTLNMKERPDLLTAEDYNSICQEMLAFQESNNRLSFADDAGEQVVAKVEDKSFSMIDDEQKAVFAAVAAEPVVKESVVKEYVPPVVVAAAELGKSEKEGGLLSSLRNLFKS
jgi:tRNA A37 methylthiotransferase MiaB